VHAKIVAGSAPTYNLLAGTLFWLILRRSRQRSSESLFFLWLFMAMNWFYGAGYFIFSGIADAGDWAVVIAGWEPGWLWRLLMTIAGVVLFFVFVRLTLKELGNFLGGEADEQLGRANTLCLLSYATAVVVVLVAGLFCPYGVLSLPVTAGLFAVAGALSPFLWMVRWYRTDRFEKIRLAPLQIHRRWSWIAAAILVVFGYTYVLGQTLYF
jgi:hypothetical protein